MDVNKTLDLFFKKHPRLFLAVVIVLTAAAAIVLLGGFRDVGLVYKAF